MKTCPIHGEFFVKGGKHIPEPGCPTCAMIKRFKKIHGDKYNYSKTLYSGYRTKLTITCPIHGDFLQRTDSHLRGNGCPKCKAKRKGFTQQEFINKCKKVFGENTYSYDKVKYTTTKEKVIVTCPIHGDFSRLAGSLIQGIGCPECNLRVKMTTDEFVQGCKEIYGGNTYSYKKTIFTRIDNKVTLTCPYHGDFTKTARAALKGHGCPMCNNKTPSKPALIARFHKIHGSKYDYSKVSYRYLTEKVTIICPEHGEFTKAIYSHLKGAGCPHCTTSHGEEKIINHLDKTNLKYQFQKMFSNCKNLRKLRFDFYLPEKKLAIEYDGKQHFQPVMFGGINNETSELRFEKQRERDEIKNIYCQDNHIGLLRIPYSSEKEIPYILDCVINETEPKKISFYDDYAKMAQLADKTNCAFYSHNS